MAKCEKYLIAGFSGAGKSSFLKELEFTAPDLGWSYADLDQLILKSKRKKQISELVDEVGWDKFRLFERQELEGWLKEDGPGFLALGGGALTQLVYDLYSPSKKIGFVYLEASFEDCWERLHLPSSEPRPLVKLGKSELHRIYLEREKIYSQIPSIVCNSRGADLEKLARNFWKEISLS